MMDPKRVWVATLSAAVLAVPDWYLALPGVIPFIPIPTDIGLESAAAALTVISLRTVTGFAIGISALRMRWWWHGILLSLIFGIPLMFMCRWAGLGWPITIFGVNGAGIVIGFLIEWITSVLFQAPAPRT